MKYDVFQLPEAYQQELDDTPEPKKVQVTLLDCDGLLIAAGTALLPLLLGVGVFWPHSPMPCANRLTHATGFSLPSGEMLKLKEISLCVGDPPHYDFWISPP